jgi:hypothetical protein
LNFPPSPEPLVRAWVVSCRCFVQSSNNAGAIVKELVEAVVAGDRDMVFALAKRLVGGTYAIIEQAELVCLIDKRVADAIGRATKEVFTRTEAAEHLRISLTTLHNLMKRGLLRPNRATGKPLFLREDLNRFLREGRSLLAER